MRTGRPKKPITLQPADKEKLEMLARRPKTAQRLAMRSKMVLRAADGLPNGEIARRLGVTGATVGSGASGFVSTAWMACPTKLDPEPRARFPTPKSRRR